MAIDYIAQHAYYITSAIYQIGGLEFKGESYIEAAYPDIVKKDVRTAEEIKAHIVKRLSE